MKKHFLKILFVLQLATAPKLFAQNIAINTTGNTPDTSAMLDISSTKQGFLMPRMTTTQMNAITLPANGLMIYNTTLNTFDVNVGTTSSPSWAPVITTQTTNASRCLSGIVTLMYNSNSPSGPVHIQSSKLIGGAAGVAYGLGTTAVTSASGGIDSLLGAGFQVSNPANGYIDIKFTTPFTQVLAVTASVFDDYVSPGGMPTYSAACNFLNTADNLHVTYISNSIIRIITGNNSGSFNNRSISFIVEGQ